MKKDGGQNEAERLENALEDAWQAFHAICMAQKADPALGENPYWLMLRGDAFEAFNSLYARHRNGQ